MKKYALLTLFAFVSVSFGQVMDPFIGTWTMNLAKSKYPKAVPLPKSMVITMEPGDPGTDIYYESKTELPTGRNSFTKYSARYNAAPVVVMTDGHTATPVTLQRSAPNIVVAILGHGKETLATSRREISADGKTMTITTTSKDKSGKTVKTVGVYERTAR